MKQVNGHEKRIAVVGSGISGLAAAYFLSRHHQVTLYEAASWFGGHAHAVEVSLEGKSAWVDTGFLVYNTRTYSNFIPFLEELGVASSPSTMSFAVSRDQGQFEWAGSSLTTLFGQVSHLLSHRFWGMILDILRFNRNAEGYLLQARLKGWSLGDLLKHAGLSEAFCEDYLIPMAACIWSAPPERMLDYPASTFLQFCLNHGLLQIFNRPQWRTLQGSSRGYVDAVIAQVDEVLLNTPVEKVIRTAAGVEVQTATATRTYDAIVMATHAPSTLQLLADADEQERAILGSFSYQRNRAWLHTDLDWMPRRRGLWSSWNFMAEGKNRQGVCVSYWLNRLQSLPWKTPLMVTLNPWREPEGVLDVFDYEHPLFDESAIQAQHRLPGLQGHRNTWYAGAWTRYGFHEDGLRSALQVAAAWHALPAWATV